MHRNLANILTYVFHPLLMATVLVVLMYFFTPSLLQPINENNILYVLIAVVILTFLIPLLSIGMLKITKSISDFKLERREERVMPFFFIAVYYGLATYMFAYKLRLSEVIVVLFGAISLVILLTALISLRYKISAHAAGIWGVAGFLTALHFKFTDSHLMWPLVITFLLAGATSSSRLALNAHSSGEVAFGSVMGFIICFVSIYIFI